MIVTQANTAIRNKLFSDVIEQLKIPIPCDISTYPMEIRGIMGNGRGQFDIRIHGYAIQPFHGPHLVSIGLHTTPFWVQSLTCFKKNFFGFTDRLSFERSIFVKFSTTLVRLKNIRFIVTLPQYSLHIHTSIYRTPEQYIPFRPSRTPLSPIPETITETEEDPTPFQKRKLILKNCVEKLLNVYNRDFACRIECIQKLTEDFCSECALIAQTMDQTPSSPSTEELNMEIELHEEDLDCVIKNCSL